MEIVRVVETKEIATVTVADCSILVKSWQTILSDEGHHETRRVGGTSAGHP